MELNVQGAGKRSHAVTAVRIGAPHGTALRTWVEEQAGLTLGIGLGMETAEDPKSDGFFRLGHMGHVNAQMVLGALATIEAGLTATGVPHGRGAVDAAAGVIAGG
jgi:alanine-glyoxylate transaminase/serine-glyoxylate transaminase/serine-pyruvate transaminase